MKYANCPICEWTLGIPDKLLGHPVTCPKCEKVFLPTVDTATESKPEKKIRKRKSKSIPSPRSLPTPAAIGNSATSSTDDLLPPPSQKSSKSSKAALKETPLPEPSLPLQDEDASTSSSRDTELTPADETRESRPQPSGQLTAQIKQAEPDNEELGADGTLPTLQLKDDDKKRIDTREIKSNPVFLGLIICASLLSSGLLLFFADFGAKPDREALNEARREIRRFYTVRSDVQLKPYQLELREAQLAHSRNDRKGEIAAYRKVMARFRAEDKSKFAGVTGSPRSDIQLEELVSTLLGDGNDK